MRTLVHITTAVLLAAGAAAPLGAVSEPREQLQFGADMAARGLWSEAFFRFRRADRLEPDSPRILNNLAVACEALGRFEDALGHYQRALELSPSDREIRGNYDRFLGFYESYKARQEQREAEAAGESAEQVDESQPAVEAPPADPLAADGSDQGGAAPGGRT